MTSSESNMCLIFRSKNHCLILTCSFVMIDQNRAVPWVTLGHYMRNSGTHPLEFLKHFIYLILHTCSMSLFGSKYNKTVQLVFT